MTARRLRVLTVDVEVTVSDPTLRDHLESLTASYAPGGDSTSLSYRVEPGALWRNGELVRRTECALDVLAVLELPNLYAAVVARARSEGWLVHAAAVERDGQVMLLVGPSGAGKSTVTLALLGDGARYLTDECALVTRDGRVFGMRRAIAFPSDEAHGCCAEGLWCAELSASSRCYAAGPPGLAASAR